MELTFKEINLIGAVVLTGLSAGLFYAWQVSVIPGTAKVGNNTYLETMQSINRAILNPAFFIVFFGSLITLSIASVYEFNTSKLVFALFLGASITYLVGTFGVTALGNVPLNNQLDVINLGEMDSQKLADFKTLYESRWNRLHLIRTIFSVLAFVLSVVGLILHSKGS